MTARSSHGPEYWEVQRPAFELLRDFFKYEYAHGDDIKAERDSEAKVILEGRLARKLKEINDGLSDSGVRQAIEALRQPVAMGLMEANEKCQRLLSRWVTVEEQVKGQAIGRSVRYIDYENPQNNEFLVVEEFYVKGTRYNRRADLVIFVNGIPAVVIECKEPGDPHGIAKAVSDLEVYQDREKGVPQLFHTAQLCMVMKKTDARYGTIETPMDRYSQWKTPYPLSLDEYKDRLGRIPTAQDVLLVGLLAKENLLEMIRTFAVFDRQGGRTVKKITRYQQFEAVNRAIERIADEKSKLPNKERGGVIWHTQGSGKSLTMLWLAVKLRRLKETKNPTILIVTDRRDLDKQITETFVNCGFENPMRAAKIKHLRRLLAGLPGQTVMTTVQKFQDDVDIVKGSTHPVLSKDENIFVLVDEAHRTEYGLFAAHLRRALPNACLIAFTGTPIEKTLHRFGSYIHKYTMPQSEADGATVPILYESRLPELAVWGNKIDPIFEAQFADLTKEKRAKLKKQEITERNIALASNRIETIAFNIAEHYKANFEPDGFKAQVVACSQEAGARYYREFEKYFPDRVALLISEPSQKNNTLNSLREKFADEDRIIDEFKHDGADKLAIIVVVDKYLTGFDAPIERVLYLDKPIKEHNLLQAIARVNRPLPEKDKAWGLIVDYWGVAGFLDKALEAFSEDLEPTDVLTLRNDDVAYETLKQRRAEVFSCFPEGLGREDIEPWLLAMEKEDAQARFLEAYRGFYHAIEQLLPDERALKFLGDFAWLRRIRREMVTQYSLEDLKLADCSEKVRELIDTHVRGQEVRVLLESVQISSDTFLEEMRKLGSPRAKASRMEHAISKTITVRMAEDPAFYESIQERLERIINERKKERIDDVKEFSLLSQLRDSLVAGQGQSARSLGVSETEFAFFNLLKSYLPESDAVRSDERVDIKNLAMALVNEIEKEAVIDWIHKEDVQREMRKSIKRGLRLNGCGVNLIDAVTVAVMDLARVRLVR